MCVREGEGEGQEERQSSGGGGQDHKRSESCKEGAAGFGEKMIK